MSDFEYVRARLPNPSNRLALETVSKGAGVPYHTLLKIAKGETEDPRTSTVNRLVIYFKAKESKTRKEARAA